MEKERFMNSWVTLEYKTEGTQRVRLLQADSGCILWLNAFSSSNFLTFLWTPVTRCHVCLVTCGHVLHQWTVREVWCLMPVGAALSVPSRWTRAAVGHLMWVESVTRVSSAWTAHWTLKEFVKVCTTLICLRNVMILHIKANLSHNVHIASMVCVCSITSVAPRDV